jgi:hypothetical protein
LADGGSPDRVLAISIGVVSLASVIALAALAFSGLALYQSFTGAVNGLSAFGRNQTSVAAFNITNGGVLTTILGVSANLSIEGVEYPAVSRQLQLQPGETGEFNLSLPHGIEDTLTEPGVLQAALFDGIDVNLTFGFALTMSPFLTATASSSQLSYVAPIVSNLDVRIMSVTPYNSTRSIISFVYSFYDSSSLSLNGTISAVLTDSLTGGSVLGSGSDQFKANAGTLNQGFLNLYANQSFLKPGVYYANLTITSSGATGFAVVPFTYSQGG